VVVDVVVVVGAVSVLTSFTTVFAAAVTGASAAITAWS